MAYQVVKGVGTLIAVVKFGVSAVEVYANQDGSTSWQKVKGTAGEMYPNLIPKGIKEIYAEGKELIDWWPDRPDKNTPQENVREIERKSKEPPKPQTQDPEILTEPPQKLIEDELKRQIKDTGITYVEKDYDYTYKPRKQLVADIEAGQKVTTAKTGQGWLPLLMLGYVLSQ